MKPVIFFILLLCSSACAEGEKILHLTFHKGCQIEFEGVAKTIGCQVETWFIPDLPPKFLDGETQGNALYNVGHARAEKIWNLHKDYFNSFDIILISDTSPLSRIFLQNNSSIPLMIWICNRFDYSDQASLDCNFPDEEYYQLFKQALLQAHVKVFAYNAFENSYVRSKGIEIGNLVVTPCAPIEPVLSFTKIPTSVERSETFFLPPYHNERFFMDLSRRLNEMGIPAYCGRYNGPCDLIDFKGIIHLPYAWSNLALFENIKLGIPYFIPSRTFFLELATQPNYFHPELPKLVINKQFDDSEWYSPLREPLFITFDSWEDLAVKIRETDFNAQRNKVKKYANEHCENTLQQWKEIVNSLTHQGSHE